MREIYSIELFRFDGKLLVGYATVYPRCMALQLAHWKKSSANDRMNGKERKSSMSKTALWNSTSVLPGGMRLFGCLVLLYWVVLCVSDKCLVLVIDTEHSLLQK